MDEEIKDFSREYDIFREEALSKTTNFYEKACNLAEKIIKIDPSEKDIEKLEQSIEACHLNISPIGSTSFATIVGLIIVFIGLVLGSLFILEGVLLSKEIAIGPVFLALLIIIIGAVSIWLLYRLPNFLANKWRLNASNQMVLCILYIVMYMRHTSNLEHAIKFAAENIGNPLALDLKKVFWDVEIGKYVTIKDSLNYYLISWREWNLEFIEAFNLIEGSLYESNEQRRIETLEKALQVILDGTYDRMLHYAHNLRTPVTILHMLGIILPILGLVIFPLIGSFMSGLVQWWHIFILYDIILPVFVIVFGINILSKRPTGYGKGSFIEKHPEFKEYERASKFFAIIIGLIFLFIGFLPFIIYFVDPTWDINTPIIGGKFLDFKDGKGPYGVGALILSLFIPLGLALSIGSYYTFKTRELIKVRVDIDNLEKEFSGAIFQLGNKVGEGIPVEVAFDKVAENLRGSVISGFFDIVNNNMRRMGMNVKDAIFNEKRGAILYYPSDLIETSMEVLVESAKKGPMVVSKALLTISNYVDRVNKVNERLNDLLAEIISSMKSQIIFLAPVIAGIVIGVASMVVNVINKLGMIYEEKLTAGEGLEGLGGLVDLIKIINIEEVIPSFQFQAVIGIYIVEVIIILTILAVSIERGIDRLSIENEIGKNLVRSVSLYFVIALIGIIIFGFLANVVGITLT